MDDPTGVIGFCHRVRPRLVGMLSLLCGDGDTAEELAQETLARVWLRWSRVRELDEPLAIAWTYRVGINLANSWLRRRVAERRAHARLAARATGAHIDSDSADAVAVRQAVAALPRRQRTALVLRYYADLPVAEESSRVVDRACCVITRRPPGARQGARSSPPCRSGRRRAPARPGGGR